MQEVSPRAADDRVIAATAFERLVSGAARRHVVAVLPRQEIGQHPTGQVVGLGGAGQQGAPQPKNDA